MLNIGCLLLVCLHMDASGARIEYAPAIVTRGDPSEPRHAVLRGVGYDGVAQLFVESDISSVGCTGVLLEGGRNLLTAAHCLTDHAGQLLPSLLVQAIFSYTGGSDSLIGAQYTVHPGWSGDVRGGNDLAIVRFARRVSPDVQTYGLFDGPGDLAADFDVAGFGAGGTGATGPTTPLGTPRHGRNTFDATMTGTVDELEGWTAGDLVLMSDFDNGTSRNDFFGSFYDRPGRGLGLNEVITAPGDSGSPAFLDGRIAGLASFGARLQFEDGSSSDIDDILNSTYGEFNGYTRVGLFASWITSETEIPEPGTTVLVFGGVLLLAFIRRSKQKKALRGKPEGFSF